MAGNEGGGPDALGSPTLASTVLRAATRTVQFVLLGLVLYTVVVQEGGLLVNTGIMLLIALIPDALAYRYDWTPQPLIALLVAVAPFLHAVGALGPYESVPAFDQFAHAISAMLVAGLGYVVVGVLDAEYDSVEIPPKLQFVFVLIFATSFGVAWEILEFGTGLLATVIGGEPLLAQYGPSDVVLDLLFNSLGALVVALWGTTYFEALRGAAVRRVED